MEMQARIIKRRIKKLERLVKIQIAIIIVMLIALGAFATNIYKTTKLGEEIQRVEENYRW